MVEVKQFYVWQLFNLVLLKKSINLFLSKTFFSVILNLDCLGNVFFQQHKLFGKAKKTEREETKIAEVYQYLLCLSSRYVFLNTFASLRFCGQASLKGREQY